MSFKRFGATVSADGWRVRVGVALGVVSAHVLGSCIFLAVDHKHFGSE